MPPVAAGLVTVAVTALGVLLLAPAANADVDCDDFASAEHAQNYYLDQYGDPDGLDRDGDGRACEWGPGPHGHRFSDGDQNGGDSSDGTAVPWWVWAGGGIAALWILGLVRMGAE